MVQEFNVLKCFKCEMFQVHQVKKAKKWDCKMCGVKQSFLRNYGCGSAKECREHVQKMNSLRMFKQETAAEEIEESSNVESLCWAAPFSSDEIPNKWDKYLDNNDTESNASEEVDGVQYVLELPTTSKKRKLDKGKLSTDDYCNEAEAQSYSISSKSKYAKVDKQKTHVQPIVDHSQYSSIKNETDDYEDEASASDYLPNDYLKEEEYTEEPIEHSIKSDENFPPNIEFNKTTKSGATNKWLQYLDD